MALVLGMMFALPGILWLLMLSRWRLPEHALESPAASASAQEEALEGRIG